jgi:hypothetical protein
MPTFIIRNKQLSVFKEPGRKKYGMYLFKEPNVFIKVGTFMNDNAANHFVDYLNDMFEELQKNEK